MGPLGYFQYVSPTGHRVTGELAASVTSTPASMEQHANFNTAAVLSGATDAASFSPQALELKKKKATLNWKHKHLSSFF